MTRASPSQDKPQVPARVEVPRIEVKGGPEGSLRPPKFPSEEVESPLNVVREGRERVGVEHADQGPAHIGDLDARPFGRGGTEETGPHHVEAADRRDRFAARHLLEALCGAHNIVPRQRVAPLRDQRRDVRPRDRRSPLLATLVHFCPEPGCGGHR